MSAEYSGTQRAVQPERPLVCFVPCLNTRGIWDRPRQLIRQVSQRLRHERRRPYREGIPDIRTQRRALSRRGLGEYSGPSSPRPIYGAPVLSMALHDALDISMLRGGILAVAAFPERRARACQPARRSHFRGGHGLARTVNRARQAAAASVEISTRRPTKIRSGAWFDCLSLLKNARLMLCDWQNCSIDRTGDAAG